MHERLYGNKSKNEVRNDTSTTGQGDIMNPTTKRFSIAYIPARQELVSLEYFYSQHNWERNNTPSQDVVLRLLCSRKNYLQNGLIRLCFLITQPPRLWNSYTTRNLGGFFVPAVLARPTSTGRIQ